MNDMSLSVRDVPMVNIHGQSATKNFCVADDNPAIFALFSDTVYSQPLVAVIREYVTNAWDSHIESGNTHIPIEITFSASPMRLIIHDFGTGLDRAEMDDVFPYYFRSTKVGKHEPTGKFGIGSKVGFAYTDQFTVTACKNGRKNVYGLHIGEDRQPQISDMLRSPDGVATEDPNGVTIDIPVKSLADLKTFKDNLIRLLETATIKILAFDENRNPIPLPESNFAEALELHGYGWRSSDQIRDSTLIHVVQGQICYPIKSNLITNSMTTLDHALLPGLFIATSSRQLQYALSRENLRETPETIAFLQARLLEIQSEVEAAANAIAITQFKTAKINELHRFRERAEAARDKAIIDEVPFRCGAEEGANRIIYAQRRSYDRYNTGTQRSGESILFNSYCAAIKSHLGKPHLSNAVADQLILARWKKAYCHIATLLARGVLSGTTKLIHYNRIEHDDIHENPYSKNRIYLDGATTNRYGKLQVWKDKDDGPAWKFAKAVFSIEATLIVRAYAPLRLTVITPAERRYSLNHLCVMAPINPKTPLSEIATDELKHALARYGLSDALVIDNMEQLSLKPPPLPRAERLAVDAKQVHIYQVATRVDSSYMSRRTDIVLDETTTAPEFFIRAPIRGNKSRVESNSLLRVLSNFLLLQSPDSPKLGLAQTGKSIKALLAAGAIELKATDPKQAIQMTGEIANPWTLTPDQLEALVIAARINDTKRSFSENKFAAAFIAKRDKTLLEARTHRPLHDLLVDALQAINGHRLYDIDSKLSAATRAHDAWLVKTYPLLMSTDPDNATRELHMLRYMEMIDREPKNVALQATPLALVETATPKANDVAEAA